MCFTLHSYGVPKAPHIREFEMIGGMIDAYDFCYEDNEVPMIE